MFNFLFEGKIGDMLAPIQSPEQQLHLAIQHHRNSEAESMINSGTVRIGAISNGCTDIHVACRFNNRYILDICLGRGISVNFPDANGNTPLHYAAKNGHVDICKHLLELKANPAARNSRKQSAYDLAESHVVRQLLLPAQLSVERDMPEMQVQTDPFQFRNGMLVGAGGSGAPMTNQAMGYAAPSPAIGAPSYAPPPTAPGAPMAMRPYVGQAADTPSPPPPSPHAGSATHSQSPSVTADSSSGAIGTHSAPSSFVGGTSFPPASGRGPPLLQTSQSTGNLVRSPLPSPPPETAAEPHVSSMPVPAGPASKRFIQADGFGSSASDPVLQKKYGHTKIVQNVAPPPTFSSPGGAPPGPTSYSLYSSAMPPGGRPYNRYVPYDINTSGNQQPPTAYGYSAPPAHTYAPPQPPVGSYSQMQPPVGMPPSAPGVGFGPPPGAHVAHSAPQRTPTNSAPPSSPNDGGMIDVDLGNDHDVVSATATSSAIL